MKGALGIINRSVLAGIVTASAVLALLVLLSPAEAAKGDPRAMITWRARSYAPSGYAGKVMPSPNSAITASLELVSSRTGKPIDLSRGTIYWYLNTSFLGGGAGAQTITFRAPGPGNNLLDLSVQASYRDATAAPAQAGSIYENVKVPVSAPLAVIEAPYASNIARINPFKLTGVPYFFNLPKNKLNFSWEINGEAPTGSERPDELVVEVNPEAPSGSEIGVRIVIADPSDILVSAVKQIILTIAR